MMGDIEYHSTPFDSRTAPPVQELMRRESNARSLLLQNKLNESSLTTNNKSTFNIILNRSRISPSGVLIDRAYTKTQLMISEKIRYIESLLKAKEKHLIKLKDIDPNNFSFPNE